MKVHLTTYGTAVLGASAPYLAGARPQTASHNVAMQPTAPRLPQQSQVRPLAIPNASTFTRIPAPAIRDRGQPSDNNNKYEAAVDYAGRATAGGYTVTSHSRPQPSRGPLAARTGRRPRSSGESEWTSGDEESPNAPPEGTGHLTGAETARQAAIIAAAVAGATFVAGEAFYRATVGRFWRPWPSQDRVDRWRGRFGGTPQLNTQVPLHQLNSGFNQGPTANQVGRHSSV